MKYRYSKKGSKRMWHSMFVETADPKVEFYGTVDQQSSNWSICTWSPQRHYKGHELGIILKKSRCPDPQLQYSLFLTLSDLRTLVKTSCFSSFPTFLLQPYFSHFRKQNHISHPIWRSSPQNVKITGIPNKKQFCIDDKKVTISNA